MNKIKQLLLNIKEQIKPKLALIDSKFERLIPDKKLKNILYIFIVIIISLIIIITIIGILLLPFRVKNDNTFSINKPSIVNKTSEPQKSMTNIEKHLLELEIKINNLRFPESILNIPNIKSNIQIYTED